MLNRTLVKGVITPAEINTKTAFFSLTHILKRKKRITKLLRKSKKTYDIKTTSLFWGIHKERVDENDL